MLTPEVTITVRKTPPGEQPFDLSALEQACDAHGSPTSGVIAYYLVDEVAERYLGVIDLLDTEIDELERRDRGLAQRAGSQAARPSSGATCSRSGGRSPRPATRSAGSSTAGSTSARTQVFDRALELDFAEASDRLLRATESLDVSRDLIASARDYHQSKIGQEQNEVVKQLAVIASLLLLPTFIVGVYGQNFDHMPELHWRLGYALLLGADRADDDRPARVLPLEDGGSRAAPRRYPGAVPFFICPNCKDRSLDHDGRQGLLRPGGRPASAAGSASSSSCWTTTTRRRTRASSPATATRASSPPVAASSS